MLCSFKFFVKGILERICKNVIFKIVFEIIFELKYLKPEILKRSQCGTFLQENKTGFFQGDFLLF
jgi:hypothetical protein